MPAQLDTTTDASQSWQQQLRLRHQHQVRQRLVQEASASQLLQTMQLGTLRRSKQSKLHVHTAVQLTCRTAPNWPSLTCSSTKQAIQVFMQARMSLLLCSEEEALADMNAFNREYDNDNSWEQLQEDEYGHLRPLVSQHPASCSIKPTCRQQDHAHCTAHGKEHCLLFPQ